MFRRNPATVALVAACVLYTGLAAILDWTPSEAGAVRNREIWDGEYWRLVTATFLHHTGFWAHLVLNAISLFFVGRVLEQACGKAAYLVCVAGAALAGFAGSLLFSDGLDYWRMGISGAIAGLVGLLLAIEWAIAKSWRTFLKQRNTIVIFFFIALSLPLALWIESRNPQVKIDHAAHAGGFLFGLLGGLAYYSRRGRRPLRGVIVAAVFGLAPILLAAHPFWNPEYLFRNGNRAYRAGDVEAAVDFYERGLDRLPPDYYPGQAHTGVAQRAFLRLAATLLESDPERARDLVGRARAMRPHAPGAWFEFAEACEAAGGLGDAYQAYALSAAAEEAPSRKALANERALAILTQSSAALTASGPEQRLAFALNVARTAELAAAGLAREEPGSEDHDRLERMLAGAAAWAAGVALAAPESEAVGELAATLARLYRVLAENTGDDARRPLYRHRSAYWYWREVGDADPEVFGWVRARFSAALSEAREVGDPKTKAAVEEWFRARGLPTPAPDPDLDGPGGGG